MVCNRSRHLPGNPKLVRHPARLIKEGGYADLSMDTLHLEYPFILLGSEGSALTLPLFLLSLFTKNNYALSLFFNNNKGPLFANILWHYMTFVCRCAFIHSFIQDHSHIHTLGIDMQCVSSTDLSV